MTAQGAGAVGATLGVIVTAYSWLFGGALVVGLVLGVLVGVVTFALTFDPDWYRR